MNNLKLLQALKAAGFPQKPYWNADAAVVYGGSWYFIPHPEGCPRVVFAEPDHYDRGIERGDDLVKDPTLEEVLEAIGDEFEALTMERSHAGNGWNALAFHSSKHGQGSTPKEAAINLYLTLKNRHA
jgi:hypothetical protein